VSDERRDDRERARHLMMAALDGEIDPGEREELERLVRGDPGLRDEWSRLSRLKEETTAMALRRPPEEVWERYWVGVYNRAERGVGWILFSVGAVVLISWGIWQALRGLLADAGIPATVKLAILAVVVGAAVLIVSVVREKLFTWRRDPYKGVER